MLMWAEDPRFEALPGEEVQEGMLRFRTLGCWPLTGGIRSDATTLDEVIAELEIATVSERQGRAIDRDQSGSMEKRSAKDISDDRLRNGNRRLSDTVPAAAPLTAQRDSRPLRLITCGSVDDGKSTLIGRLLWDTKAVKEDRPRRCAATPSASRTISAWPDFALLLDGLQAEREQGITIDVAYRYFATDKRSFIVADTPGHEQYTRNMATGASTADLAVLLVDARAGILEQTRRHATIASLMGIRQFVLAVNKFDLTNYDRARFEEIANEFREIALSLGIRQVTAIPMSALKGENVVYDGRAAMPWYEGPTLVEFLDRPCSLRPGRRLPPAGAARVAAGESFRGYQGTVAGGAVKPGDSIVVLPSGMVANVTKIVTFDLVRNAASRAMPSRWCSIVRWMWRAAT